ncbi:SsgA family sporulation/cell division regulator [Streptomyces sp. NPDC093970]|uniref:SsgA family sporulation/cell division regulator n=1 Tax=unclassified Streptomyces TaxID=2593676 RepID=UPI003437F109
MSSSSGVISRRVSAFVVAPDESAVPVPTDLRYDAADPFAVHAAFQVGAGRTVEWFFARGLLAEGLRGPAGIGDVRLRPTRHLHRHMLRITLASPGGRADLIVPRAALADFLRRTDALVPPGTEHVHLDLDAQLSEFLAGH